MTISPDQDITCDHAAAAPSGTTLEDTLQRLEEVLALGYRQGEGVPELRRCLEEFADDSTLVADHPNIVTARGHLAHWTWQAGDICESHRFEACF